MTNIRWFLVVAAYMWVLGWLVCSVAYIVFAKKDAAEAGRPFPWQSTLSRLAILVVFWPLLAITAPFVLSRNTRLPPGKQRTDTKGAGTRGNRA